MADCQGQGAAQSAHVTGLGFRLNRVLRDDLDQRQRSALASWLAFTGTFAGVRAITYSIKAGRGPFRNLSAGGEHLHHYLWGIAMLAGVGAVFDLKDVYWAQQGRISVDLGIGGVAVTGCYFAALPAVRALHRDLRCRDSRETDGAAE